MSCYYRVMMTELVNHLKNVHTICEVCDIYIYIYCILRGQIKGFNRSITTILFEVGSYRTVVG